MTRRELAEEIAEDVLASLGAMTSVSSLGDLLESVSNETYDQIEEKVVVTVDLVLSKWLDGDLAGVKL